MNYVFVNKAEPETKSRSRSGSTSKSKPQSSPATKPKPALEKYEKEYLARLEKQSQPKADSIDEE